METLILKILIGVVCFYLLCGVVITWVAIHYMVGTAATNAEYAEQVRRYKAMSRRAKIKTWLHALWFGVVCWILVITGIIKTPSIYKDSK